MKTQSAFINPVTLPPCELWTPAEERLVQCMAQGEKCIIGDERPSPDIGKNKQPSVSIRSEIIRFFALGGSEEFPVKGSNIYVQGALVPDRLNLLFAEVPYVLSFMSCYFTQNIGVMHAKCRAIYLNGSHLAQGLSGDGVRVDGTISLRQNFSAEGEVRIVNAEIGGALDCSNGKFDNPARYAINAAGARVKSHAFMRDGFSAKGSVVLTGAVIDGNLDCVRGTFSGHKTGYALAASGVKIGGNLLLQNRFSAEGVVYFPNASVGENMNCKHGSFHNEGKGKSALFADGIKIGGNLSLQNSSFKGLVRLPDANVNGNMSCSGGSFIGTGQVAIVASRLKVGGNLSFQAGFSANGETRLTAANIGGSFFGGGSFNKKGGRSLTADRITIQGNLYLRQNFSVKGDVRFPAANIGGSIYVDESEITGKFNVKAAMVKNSLRLRKVRGNGTVNLSFASVDVLNDDKESRDNLKFKLYGFSYARFADHEGTQSRADWLNRRPENTPFSPQPFEQAAKVLFAMGHNSDAREILRAKEKRLTEQQDIPFWQKILRKSWNLFAGYGYRARRTLAWSAAVVIIGCGMFNAADRYCYIAPHQSAILAYKKHYEHTQIADECKGIARPTEHTACLFPEYPQFNALVYSLDVFIPFFALHQEPYWHPLPQESDIYAERWLFVIWHWFEIAAGWLLTSLFVLSVTGLLRPRQTSGDK